MCWASVACAGDLAELKHLGVPYANFVTGSGDGLDVDMMKRFAEHLGVRYEYVQTDWQHLIGDISGEEVDVRDGEVAVRSTRPAKGDVGANGITMLAWRAKVVDFAEPMFPTQVWLIARADSDVEPITPSGEIERDISRTKQLLSGRTVFGKAASCLDPALHRLEDHGAQVRLFDGALNELAPAIIRGEAEMTILDVPDALIALEKWPGQIKVIGPVTVQQTMSCAFARSSPELRAEYQRFFRQCCADGTYRQLVMKYYPRIASYYPEFFESLWAERP